jgi:hypothetical protein
MKILFFARHYTYLRNFESVLVDLAQRGHTVHIAVEQEDALGGTGLIARLTSQFPSITAGLSPKLFGRAYSLATKLRFGIDYLRYLAPAYAEMPRLKLRARDRAPVAVLRLSERWPFSSSWGRRLMTRVMSGIEQAMPCNPDVLKFLEQHRPDAVLLTPLIGVVQSPQLDYLYAARQMGIPTTLCVWSWDHLSSKAIIRTVPDRVLVWNPTQEREAIEMHGVPRSRVVVTGAQCFDQWFDRSPSRSRAEFCRRVGLPDDRPFLLWVCSALFKGSPVEAEFVVKWIRALRASAHAELRDASILVRPHPARLTEWEAIDLRQFERVALWGGNPVDAEPRADYFDSLHYSTAIAGLNTSAFIEGAIAERPVYTILPPEYYDNQEGTLHFHYLLNVGGGLLRASRTFDEHAADLAAAMRGEGDAGRSRRFVEAFVRPQGLSVASTPRFVHAIESLPSVERAPVVAPGLVDRALLAAFEAWTRTRSGWLLMYDEAGMAKERRKQLERANTRTA